MRFLTILGSVLCFSLSAQTTLIDEDFTNGIPADYILINDGRTPNPSVSEYTEAWITIPDYDDEHGTVASATSYFTPVFRANRWMIVPNVQLGAFGNILSWDMKSQDPTFPEALRVMISTTGTEKENFTDTLYLNTFVSSEWMTKEINMALNGYANQQVHIAFILQTVDGFKLHLDNLKIVKESNLKINETFLSDVQFANPFTNELKVNSSEQIVSLSLYNLSGQVVLTTTDNILNTDMINKGMYILEIKTSNNYFKTKVLKN